MYIDFLTNVWHWKNIFDRAPIDRCDEIGRIFIFEIFEFSRFSKIEKSISALFVDPEGKKT